MPGFRALAFFPFIFVRKEARFTETTKQHERIHFMQQKELSPLLFLVMYLLFFIIYRGYETIPFEREARENETNKQYHKTRKAYAFTNYLTLKKETK